MQRGVSSGTGVILAIVGCLIGATGIASAQTLQSPSYRFDESVIGAGGLNQSSSTNYQASSSTGQLAIGNSASENLQVEAGDQTTDDPALSFSFNDPEAKLGNFTSAAATMTTASFSVSNYTSYGYAIYLVGGTPSNGDHELPAMAATGPSQSGIEQFGVNLVANTDPESIGANPNHGLFGVGSATPNYATPNEFRYVSGESIASAPESSGVTTYTISYLVNVDSLTPGGKYGSKQTVIVTGTY